MLMAAPKSRKEKEKQKKTKIFALMRSRTLSFSVANQLLPGSIPLRHWPEMTAPFAFAFCHPGPLVHTFLVAGVLLVSG
jgi:hypothetical protein